MKLLKDSLKVLMMTWVLVLGGALLMSTAGCSGSGEESGETIDNAMDKAADAVENTADNAADAMEKAADKAEDSM